jgi:hypothetical protein
MLGRQLELRPQEVVFIILERPKQSKRKNAARDQHQRCDQQRDVAFRGWCLAGHELLDSVPTWQRGQRSQPRSTGQSVAVRFHHTGFDMTDQAINRSEAVATARRKSVREDCAVSDAGFW